MQACVNCLPMPCPRKRSSGGSLCLNGIHYFSVTLIPLIMKQKLIVSFILFTFITMISMAQEYKPVKVGPSVCRSGVWNIFTASTKLSGTSSGGSSVSSEVSEESKFGFYPRVGFDYGHFSFNIEYNLIPESESKIVTSSGSGTTTTTGTVKNNYLGVKFGFFFGGGIK